MRRGFTLIEMLVVMALFMTLMLVVSDIFLSVSLVQRKTLAREQGAKEMQFVLEQLAQAIRLNKINYSHYKLPLTGQVEDLALIDADQKETIYTLTSTGCAVSVTECIKKSVAGVEAIISPSNVNIEELKFSILPLVDPYAYNESAKKFTSDETPLVSIYLTAKDINANQDERKIVLQTTMTTRYYER